MKSTFTSFLLVVIAIFISIVSADYRCYSDSQVVLNLGFPASDTPIINSTYPRVIEQFTYPDNIPALLVSLKTTTGGFTRICYLSSTALGSCPSLSIYNLFESTYFRTIVRHPNDPKKLALIDGGGAIWIADFTLWKFEQVDFYPFNHSLRKELVWLSFYSNTASLLVDNYGGSYLFTSDTSKRLTNSSTLHPYYYKALSAPYNSISSSVDHDLLAFIYPNKTTAEFYRVSVGTGILVTTRLAPTQTSRTNFTAISFSNHGCNGFLAPVLLYGNGNVRIYPRTDADSFSDPVSITADGGVNTFPFIGVSNIDSTCKNDIVLCSQNTTDNFKTVSCRAYMDGNRYNKAVFPIPGLATTIGNALFGNLNGVGGPDFAMSGYDTGFDVTRIAFNYKCVDTECYETDIWNSCVNYTCKTGWERFQNSEDFCIPQTASVANKEGYCLTYERREDSWCLNGDDTQVVYCHDGTAIQEACPANSKCFWSHCVSCGCLDIDNYWWGCGVCACDSGHSAVPNEIFCLPMFYSAAHYSDVCEYFVEQKPSLFGSYKSVSWSSWTSGYYFSCFKNESLRMLPCPFVAGSSATPFSGFIPCSTKSNSNNNGDDKNLPSDSKANSASSLKISLFLIAFTICFSSKKSFVSIFFFFIVLFVCGHVSMAQSPYDPPPPVKIDPSMVTTKTVGGSDNLISMAVFKDSAGTHILYSGDTNKFICSTDLTFCSGTTIENFFAMESAEVNGDVNGYSDVLGLKSSSAGTEVYAYFDSDFNSANAKVFSGDYIDAKWAKVKGPYGSVPVILALTRSYVLEVRAKVSEAWTTVCSLSGVSSILDVTDVDEDGSDEVVLNSSHHVKIYQRIPGQLCFTEIDEIYDDSAESYAAAWCDLDCDGAKELVVAKKTSWDTYTRVYWGDPEHIYLLHENKASDFFFFAHQGYTSTDPGDIRWMQCLATNKLDANKQCGNSIIACGDVHEPFCEIAMWYSNGNDYRTNVQVGSITPIILSGIKSFGGVHMFNNNVPTIVLGTYLTGIISTYTLTNYRACNCYFGGKGNLGCDNTTCACQTGWELGWNYCYPRTAAAAAIRCEDWSQEGTRCLNHTHLYTCEEKNHILESVTPCASPKYCVTVTNRCIDCECNTTDLQCIDKCGCDNLYTATEHGVCIPDSEDVENSEHWCRILGQSYQKFFANGSQYVDFSPVSNNTYYIRCSLVQNNDYVHLTTAACPATSYGNTPFADRIPCGGETKSDGPEAPTPSAEISGGTNSNNNNNGNNTNLLIAIIVPIVGVVCIAAIIAVIVIAAKRRRKSGGSSRSVSAASASRSEAAELSVVGDVSKLKKYEADNLLGLKITPASLVFGSNRMQIPVEKDVTEELKITNTGNKKISWRIVLPDFNAFKFKISATNTEGELSPDEEVSTTITLRFMCTTVCDTVLRVAIPKKGVSEIKIRAESQLSAKIDESELVLGEVIGRGGFGTVYKGEWRGTVTAIKSYNETVVTDEVLRNDLIREIEMCVNLRMPNIVTTYGSAFTEKNCYLVMEFVPLGSLGSIVQKNKGIALNWKVRVAQDVAHGMDFLHQNRIIHRDLKTDNVLICSMDPRAPVVGKLSDFNTSRFIGSEANRTKTKGVGTPVYMAPEILDGKKYSQKADVYSFGILLWALWTQEEPYKSFETQFGIYKHVLEGNRPQIPKGLPEALKEVTTASWAHAQEERPSFHQLSEQLDAITL